MHNCTLGGSEIPQNQREKLSQTSKGSKVKEQIEKEKKKIMWGQNGKWREVKRFKEGGTRDIEIKWKVWKRKQLPMRNKGQLWYEPVLYSKASEVPFGSTIIHQWEERLAS